MNGVTALHRLAKSSDFRLWIRDARLQRLVDKVCAMLVSDVGDATSFALSAWAVSKMLFHDGVAPRVGCDALVCHDDQFEA